MKQVVVTSDFRGGILSPDLFGRTDLEKYKTGVADAVNFAPEVHGPLVKRNGSRYIGCSESGYTDPTAIPFSIDGTSSAVIELYPEDEVAYVIEDGEYIGDMADHGVLLFDSLAEGTDPLDGLLLKTEAGSESTPRASGLFYLTDEVSPSNTVLHNRWVWLEFIETTMDGSDYVHAYSIRDLLNHDPVTLVEDAAFTPGQAYSILVLAVEPDTDNPTLTGFASDFGWAQSYDVLTLVNANSLPLEISRQATAPFPTYSVNSFTATTSSNLVVTSGTSSRYPAGSGTLDDPRNRYAVTTVDANGLESLPLRLTAADQREVYAIDGANSATAGELTLVCNFPGEASHYFRPDDRVRLTGLTTPHDVYNQPEGEFYLVKEVTSVTEIVVVKEGGADFDTTVAYTNPLVGTILGPVEGYLAMDATELDLSTAPNACALQWDAVAGAVKYRVYKARSGVYGFIGESDSPFFRDDNITPDTSMSPPIDRSTEDLPYPFHYDASIGVNNYPVAVAYWGQRRVFAGGHKYPQRMWLSRVGDYSNFDTHSPLRDDDAIEITLASFVRSSILHVVPAQDLLVLTDNGEWRVGSGSGVVTPSNIQAIPQGAVPASPAGFARLGLDVVYATRQAGRLYALSYADSSAAFVGEDVSIFAAELFAGKTLRRLCATRWGTPVVWVLFTDGSVLSCAYSRTQQTVAWARHTFPGTVLDIASVQENGVDVLYLFSSREHPTAGACVYADALYEPRVVPLVDARHADSWLPYSGSPSATVSGLQHLEGESVVAIADGFVETATVSAGAITLSQAASNVAVGLRMTGRVEFLPALSPLGDAMNILSSAVRVNGTNTLRMGTTADTVLPEVELRTTEDYDAPVALQTRNLNVPVTQSWEEQPAVVVESAEPLPCRVLFYSTVLAGRG